MAITERVPQGAPPGAARRFNRLGAAELFTVFSGTYLPNDDLRAALVSQISAKAAELKAMLDDLPTMRHTVNNAIWMRNTMRNKGPSPYFGVMVRLIRQDSVAVELSPGEMDNAANAKEKAGRMVDACISTARADHEFLVSMSATLAEGNPSAADSERLRAVLRGYMRCLRFEDVVLGPNKGRSRP